MPSKTCQHNLSLFKSLIEKGCWRFANQRRINKFKDKEGWNDEDIAYVLCCLQSDDFVKTVADRRVTDLEGHSFVSADQYLLNWHLVKNCRVNSYGNDVLELSIKIAIVSMPDGETAACVTFHGPGDQ